MKDIIETAYELIKKYTLCDECLGRFFALMGTGLTNKERGRALKTLLLMRYLNDKELVAKLAESGHEPAINAAKRLQIEINETKCVICGGLFEKLEDIISPVLEELKKYEFSTFLVGIQHDDRYEAIQENIASLYNISTAESFRNNLSREFGKIIMRSLNKVFSNKPDITILYNAKKGVFKILSNPYYIEGRYMKYTRDIPQSKTCRFCHGRGCEKCDFTGREECVEYYILKPAIKLFEASRGLFHAAGREDKDVRMLGTGRPFVIELKTPRKRNIPLDVLEKEINTSEIVKVKDLKPSSKKRLVELKRTAEFAEKEYIGIVESEKEVKKDDLKILEKIFTNKTVSQYTPVRVLRERPNKLRTKKVYWLKCEYIDEKHFRFRVRTQGGLYIKELVDGDNGRTHPSFAEVLGVPMKCVQLDVVGVYEIGETAKL